MLAQNQEVFSNLYGPFEGPDAFTVICSSKVDDMVNQKCNWNTINWTDSCGYCPSMKRNRHKQPGCGAKSGFSPCSHLTSHSECLLCNPHSPVAEVAVQGATSSAASSEAPAASTQSSSGWVWLASLPRDSGNRSATSSARSAETPRPVDGGWSRGAHGRNGSMTLKLMWPDSKAGAAANGAHGTQIQHGRKRAGGMFRLCSSLCKWMLKFA